jgi:hypothetical protein
LQPEIDGIEQEALYLNEELRRVKKDKKMKDIEEF